MEQHNESRRRAAAGCAAQLEPELRAAGIHRLVVTFVNHSGQALVKVVPLVQLVAAARDGVGFSPVADAFGVDGTIDPLHPLARPDGDLRLVADLAGLLPLSAAEGWAWAPGDRYDRDGAPYAADQRGFCRRQLAALGQDGLTASAGFELEWLLAAPAADGEWRPALAGGPYGAARLVEGLDYVAAITDALDAAGLPWLQCHPEYGPSQFELSLAAADPLTAADRLVAARLIIQRVSRRCGLRASFSPLPFADQVGNGGHLHLSLQRHGQPLLQGGRGPGGLTVAGAAALAGLLQQLPALLPIACPLEVSYRRLGPGRWSAPFQAWGVENRETALRLIPSGGDGAAAHLELKVADLSANPYLLVGALLAVLRASLTSGLPLPLPPPVEGDPARLGEAAPARLPACLAEASSAFAASALLREAMGELLHSTLLASQQAEQRRCAAMDSEQLIASTRWYPLVAP